MSRCNNIDSIGSTNVTASSYIDTYIVNATASITITLPGITTDGMHFTFSRVDNTINTVTITVQPLTSDNISVSAGVLVTSITVDGYQCLEFHSYSGVWYGIYKSTVSPSGSALFSSAGVGNNSNPFVSINIIYFPYQGTSSGNIINYLVLEIGQSNSVTWTFGYTTNGTTLNTITTFTDAGAGNNNPRVLTYTLSNPDKALLPTSDAVLYLSNTRATNYYNLLVF